MNFYEMILIEIKSLETGFGMRHKQTGHMRPEAVMEYYNTLCNKIEPWEDEHQQEFKY